MVTQAQATGVGRALDAYRSANLVSASRTIAVGAAAAMTSSRSSDCVIRIMVERLCGILHPRYELIHLSSVAPLRSMPKCGTIQDPPRAARGGIGPGSGRRGADLVRSGEHLVEEEAL
jgi:hypothetical protein